MLVGYVPLLNVVTLTSSISTGHFLNVVSDRTWNFYNIHSYTGVPDRRRSSSIGWDLLRAASVS